MPATLLIKPWNDPIVDTLGHDPRSRYVETFWLPTLGPTALLLLRHLADRFDRTPEGVELTVSDTSHALGLGHRDGSASPLVRTLRRLTQFDLACEDPMSDTVAVRRNVPPVNTRHLRRLPNDLQFAHAEWAEAELAEAPLAAARRRSRRVAFTLLEQGDDPDHVERALHAIGFHPALCHESAQWGRTNATAKRSSTRRDSRRDAALTEPARGASSPPRSRPLPNDASPRPRGASFARGATVR